RKRHAPVFKRTSRIGAVELKINSDVTSDLFGQIDRLDKRGIALQKTHNRGAVSNRKKSSVCFNNTFPQCPCSRITRSHLHTLSLILLRLLRSFPPPYPAPVKT